MPRCLCLKLNGQQCSRDASDKIGQDDRFCWQHQSCQNLQKIPVKKIPTKKKP